MKYLFFVLSFFLSATVFGQRYLPTNSGEIVEHSYYTLSYSEANEQAEWVYYELTPEFVNGSAQRSDNFRSDPKVTSYSASLTDYKGKGYDRGHLCPAAAMRLNSTAMSETFYLSNMSPQLPGFNRGIWKRIETTVRGWATTGKVYVVTGPVFDDNLGVIGNGVTVPGYYYKVIYDEAGDKMIGFLLRHSTDKKDVMSYVVSVDLIEARTGIDFFSQLEDSKENRLEAHSEVDRWNFSVSSQIGRTHQSTNKSGMAVQCKGIAKSTGKRCKNKTTNENGYCRYHQNQAQ